MRTRGGLAVASGVLGFLLPTALLATMVFVSDHSNCEGHGFDCLGVFFQTGLLGLPIMWLVWSLVLARLGQRHAWLVPLASALTLVAVFRLAEPLTSYLSFPGGLPQPVMMLAGATWAALLGPKQRTTSP